MYVMGLLWILVLWLLHSGVLVNRSTANPSPSSRPKVVNVGAILAFDSTIGRVAKIAIEEAIKDVNSDPSVLKGTKLHVDIRNSDCSGFLGLVEVLRFMGTGVVAIIGPQSSVVAHAVLNVANELQTPFLSFAATDPALSFRQFPYFVRTTQSDLYQMEAVTEIVDYYGWKEVIAIYVDSEYGRNGIYALDDSLAARRCRISHKVMIPLGNGVTRDDIMDVLLKVSQMESRVIVLHAYPEVGLMVFSVARYLGMMDYGYVWITTDWLSSALDSSLGFSSDKMKDNMQGVLVLRQHMPESGQKQAFKRTWDKLAGNLVGLNTYGLYAYDTVWLLARAIDSFFNQGGVVSFSNVSRMPSLKGNPLNLEGVVSFNGGPLLLKNIMQTDFVGLTGQVKFSPNRSLAFPAYDIINVIGTGLHRVGYWSSSSGLSTAEPAANHSSESKRMNSVVWPGESATIPRGWGFSNNGKQLRIGVPRRVSYNEFVSQVRGSNVSEGFCIDVFVEAVNLLPYALPYQFVPFGNGLDNPNYDELVNLVTSGYFDGAVGDIAIVANRTRTVDFTQPFAESGLGVVAPVKKIYIGGWAFLRPFSLQMWGATAGCFIVIGIVVWILEHRFNDQFRGEPKQQLVNVLWFSLSTLFFSHKETVVSTLGRLVLIIWLFVVLIINSSYTASLTSTLMVQHLSSPLKGIESLKEGKDPIGYQVGSFTEHYLTESMGIAKSRLRAIGSSEDCARALELGPSRGGVVAVVDELPYIKLFLSSQCKFRIIGQEFTKSGWGFAFPRGSPLSIDLSKAILTLSENGELQRIQDKWLTMSDCSTDNTELKPDRLHFKSFWGLFLVSGIACCVAVLIHFIRVCNKYRKAGPDEYISRRPAGSSRSNWLQTLISIMDDKKDISRGGRKRRKLEKTLAGIERDANRDLERGSKREDGQAE